MSKIAEKRALEAYPISVSKNSVEAGFDWNEEYRDVFMEGYNQATNDFIEKACKWLQDHTELLRITDEDGNLYQEFINDFKKDMEK